MGCRLLTVSDKVLWRQYLEKLPDTMQDVYFFPEYYELHENDFVKGECFVYEDKGELAVYPYLKSNINGIVKFEFDSRYYDIDGAYGYNGILANTDNKVFLNKFASVFIDFCRNENVIAEFTRFNPVLKNNVFSPYMDIERVNENVIVDLNMPKNDIWMKSYKHCVRKSINKARRGGLRVISYMGFELGNYWLNEFLKVYYSTMDRNNTDRSYYFNKLYFNKMRGLLGKNSFFFFTLLKDKVISCELVMFSRKTAYSLLGGTLSEYYLLRPNNLLKHEIIDKFKKLNLSAYCIGGGITLNDGIYRYKQTFSRDGARDFYIGKKIHNEKVYYEICNLWREHFPEKAEKRKNYFLKYKA